jgi:hypothetical protein
MTLPLLDQPPPGLWHAVEMFKDAPKADWVAALVDELGSSTARCAWVRVPGKHRSRQSAWDAFKQTFPGTPTHNAL